ncbi:MAG: hypothetical protein AVDCRST_MAG19-3013, partial [uncultured Thermomicrobiales bacterium]
CSPAREHPVRARGRAILRRGPRRRSWPLTDRGDRRPNRLHESEEPV